MPPVLLIQKFWAAYSTIHRFKKIMQELKIKRIIKKAKDQEDGQHEMGIFSLPHQPPPTQCALSGLKAIQKARSVVADFAFSGRIFKGQGSQYKRLISWILPAEILQQTGSEVGLFCWVEWVGLIPLG